MRAIRPASICGLILAMGVSLAACGNDSPAVNQTSQAPAVRQEVTKVEEATVEAVVEAPDVEAEVDELVGNWAEAADATRFANVTKTGEEYQFEDNEGKYPGTFEDGILKIKVTETDTADVYIDKDTGNMILTYGDNKVEYVRK